MSIDKKKESLGCPNALFFLLIQIFLCFLKEDIHFLVCSYGYADIVVYSRKIEISYKYLLRFKPFKVILHIKPIICCKQKVCLRIKHFKAKAYKFFGYSFSCFYNFRYSFAEIFFISNCSGADRH